MKINACARGGRHGSGMSPKREREREFVGDVVSLMNVFRSIMWPA